MNEFNMCRFCRHYDNFEGCAYGCYEGKDFDPVIERFREKAKEEGISLHELCMKVFVEDCWEGDY